MHGTQQFCSTMKLFPIMASFSFNFLSYNLVAGVLGLLTSSYRCFVASFSRYHRMASTMKAPLDLTQKQCAHTFLRTVCNSQLLAQANNIHVMV